MPETVRLSKDGEDIEKMDVMDYQGHRMNRKKKEGTEFYPNQQPQESNNIN